MKKNLIITASALLLLSSCGTYTGSGAYMGTSLGSILGSAIGGIAGGPRGSDIGTIVGAASGAIVGAAAGNATEQKLKEEQHEVLARRNQRIQNSKNQNYVSREECDDSYNTGSARHYADTERGYSIDPTQMVDTTNSGDDRIDFAPFDGNSAAEGTQGGTEVPAQKLYGEATAATPSGTFVYNNIEIRNVNFTDTDGDGTLTGGEVGKVVFEIFNRGTSELRGIEPTVATDAGKRSIYISPGIMVESIAPGQGIRYTATVKADQRIKDGSVKLLVSASRQGKPLSYVTVVTVPTKRK